MDAQDFRSLQEAYMEVVENQQLDEISIGNRARNTVADDRLDAEQERTNASMNRLRNQSKRFNVSRASASLAAKKVEGDLRKSNAYGPQRPNPGTVGARRIEGPRPTGSKPSGYKMEQIDLYDIILSHLLDEGYAETQEAAEAIMVNMSEEWRESIMIDEGLDMKTFKANRKKAKASAASADAKKRGHVGKEWYNSGRRYSPDEAKRSRANMDDAERSTRHRSAVDPDNENDDAYSADKTKNPKKLRKQKAMGELGENVSSGSARRARFGVKQRVSSAEIITNTQKQNKIAQHFADHAAKKKSAGDEAHAAATKAGKSPSDAETARNRAHREYEKQLKRG